MAGVVLDSSCWIEWFADLPAAETFAPATLSGEPLLVPVIALYEVVRWLGTRVSVAEVQRAAMVMRNHRLIDLDVDLAMAAARLSKMHKLPMADSMIYATARRHDAVLWTMDADFEGLEGVRSIARVSRP